MNRETLIANVALTIMSMHDEMRSIDYALTGIAGCLSRTKSVLDEDAIVNCNRIANEHIEKLKQLNKEILDLINNSINKGN